MTQTGKNIVLCLDGTGNHFREDNSNVVKLFQVLQRQRSTQLAYYDPGVGTLADPGYKTPVAKTLNKGFGLAFGRGLTRNVEDAYSYLMEHWEEDDRIYIFGFSRGAYTARALAGFIRYCGVLEPGCQNLIPYAMKLYKAKKRDWAVASRFKKTYARRCEIEFLGLWDTVSTFGWIYNPVFLPYSTNNDGVRAIRHAVAIDEKRAFFRLLLWGRKHLAEQDVKEVWFAGSHSDVGGSYPEKESGLAKLALRWMIEEARDHFGLLVREGTYRKLVLGKDPKGRYAPPSHEGEQHESLTVPWWPVELLPRRSYWWDERGAHRRWRLPHPWRRRTIREGSTLHHSVLSRVATGTYHPRNLPGSVQELEDRFEVEGPPAEPGGGPAAE